MRTPVEAPEHERGRPAGRAGVSRGAAFAWVAYALTLVFVAGNAATPLYVLYQRQFGFADGVLTVVFVCYTAGVLVALVGFGGLSDRIGRRRVLLPALALSMVSAVLFATAAGVVYLCIARLAAGLAAGLFNGAATAALAELHPSGNRRRASLVAAAAPVGGIAAGPLVGGLFAQYAPAPTTLVFLVVLALLVPAAAGLLLLPEPVARHAGRVAWRPQPIGVPAGIRAPFAVGSASFATGFTAAGLFLSLGPTAAAELLHVDNRAIAGGVVFLLFAVSAGTQLALRGRVPTRPALVAGLVIVIAGLGLTVAAETAASLGLFLAGAVAVGVGQGLTWDGGLALINLTAPPSRRGEVIAAFYTTGYTLAGILVIALGFVSDAVGLATATAGFAAVVTVLALAALAAVVRGRRTGRQARLGSRA